jgi:small-conductance mechanosensitive channel
MPPSTLQTLEQVGEQLLTNMGDFASKAIISVAVVIILLFVRKTLNKLILKNTLTSPNAYFWHKVVGYSITGLMVLIVGAIWFYGVQNLATFLGLLVAGLIVALQEPLSNLAGWMIILARHPIALGDRIEINKIQGDVIDLGPLYFSIMEIGEWVDADQSTGRIIHIPNRMVFSNAIANYTQQFPYIWNELPVSITFESNWQKAKEILQAILEETTPVFSEREKHELESLATRYFIKLGTMTPIVYTSVSENGILLTMRFLTLARQRRNLELKIWEAVLEAFEKEDDIAFAYQTQRVFYNPREGKSGVRQWPSGKKTTSSKSEKS